MKLVIVESPNKVKKIEKFFADAGIDGVKVAASFGHVADLPTHDLGIDSDLNPIYELTTSGKKTVAYLRKLAKRADEVLLATDPDREGEAIALHLARELKLKNPLRITFQEITARAVIQAYNAPRKLDRALCEAQETRRVLDRLVGYIISPELSSRAGIKLSAGRVQSPAVKIVAYRQTEIQNFKSRKYYEVVFPLEGEDVTAKADLSKYLNEREKHLYDGSVARKLADSISSLKVSSVEREEKKAPAPKPLTTTSLQTAAHSTLDFSPKQTMQHAQELFENGLITYIRSDSPTFSEEGFLVCQAAIEELGYTPRTDPPKGSGNANAQEAHEAIRPTDPSKAEAAECSPGAIKLYRLIREHSLLAAMPDAVDNLVKVNFISDFDDVPFEAIAKTEKEPGYRALAADFGHQQTRDESRFKTTPEAGDEYAGGPDVVESKTKAPKRFSEASLIRAMEKLGIGRPSTYASILENIKQRGYIKIQKGQLYVTDLGMALVGALDPLSFMNLNYTAIVEKTLDQIAEGKSSYRVTISGIKANLEEQVSLIQIAPQIETASCPGCEETVKRVYSKAKDFYFWVHVNDDHSDSCNKYIQDCDGEPVITFEDNSAA